MRIPNQPTNSETPKPNIIKHKQCKACKIYKPIIQFHKNSRNKDGLQTYCKQCLKDYKYSRTYPSKSYQPVNKNKIIHKFLKYCKPQTTYKQSLHDQYLPPTDPNQIAYFLAEMKIPRKYNEETFTIISDIWESIPAQHAKIIQTLAMYCHLFYPKGHRQTPNGFSRPVHKPSFKLCHSCQKVKPTEGFYASFYSTDGLSKNCKNCTKPKDAPRTEENNDYHRNLADNATEFLEQEEE